MAEHDGNVEEQGCAINWLVEGTLEVGHLQQMIRGLQGSGLSVETQLSIVMDDFQRNRQRMSPEAQEHVQREMARMSSFIEGSNAIDNAMTSDDKS